MALPFASVFFGHQLSACLLFGAFVLLFRIRHGELTNRYGYLAGLLAGYAIITEYPTALIVGALGVYWVWPLTTRWREALRFALGGLPPLVVAGVYNTLAFGGPLSQGYAHLAGPLTFQRGQAQGFMGITYPHLDALWQTTFGPYRGLFVLSPVLVLSIPGFILLARRTGWRREVALWVAIVLIYGLFVISYYAWDGGYSLGPRHFLPALPFLILPLAELVRPGRAQFWRVTTAILACVSIAIVTLATATGPLMNPAFTAPLSEYVVPALLGLPTDPAHPAASAANLGRGLLRSVPFFPHAVLDNNWGMLFGLPGLFQLLPLITSIVLILAWRTWRTHVAAARLARTLPGSR
jgi:4-amino-4-deoxy-L-arabinose transferase-like glycosyltransferase